VGWYRTGLQIESNSTAIYESMIYDELSKVSNKISKKAGPELEKTEYIHLLIDTALKNNKLTIKAYIAIPIRDPLQEKEYDAYLKEKKTKRKISKTKTTNNIFSISKITKKEKEKRSTTTTATTATATTATATATATATKCR